MLQKYRVIDIAVLALTQSDALGYSGVWVDEAQERLLIATESFSSLFGVWKKCCNTPMALCGLSSMSLWSKSTVL